MSRGVHTLYDVQQRSAVDGDTGCWNWQCARYHNGYGAVWHNGKVRLAHRVAYAIAADRQPEDAQDICHTCDNRACVNPEHLFAGSRSQNLRDCVRKGRINRRLSPAVALEIASDQRAVTQIAAAYGLNRSTVHRIKTGRSWSAVTRGTDEPR